MEMMTTIFMEMEAMINFLEDLETIKSLVVEVTIRLPEVKVMIQLLEVMVMILLMVVLGAIFMLEALVLIQLNILFPFPSMMYPPMVQLFLLKKKPLVT